MSKVGAAGWGENIRYLPSLQVQFTARCFKPFKPYSNVCHVQAEHRGSYTAALKLEYGIPEDMEIGEREEHIPAWRNAHQIKKLLLDIDVPR